MKSSVCREILNESKAELKKPIIKLRLKPDSETPNLSQFQYLQSQESVTHGSILDEYSDRQKPEERIRSSVVKTCKENNLQSKKALFEMPALSPSVRNTVNEETPKLDFKETTKRLNFNEILGNDEDKENLGSSSIRGLKFVDHYDDQEDESVVIDLERDFGVPSSHQSIFVEKKIERECSIVDLALEAPQFNSHIPFQSDFDSSLSIAQQILDYPFLNRSEIQKQHQSYSVKEANSGRTFKGDQWEFKNRQFNFKPLILENASTIVKRQSATNRSFETRPKQQYPLRKKENSLQKQSTSRLTENVYSKFIQGNHKSSLAQKQSLDTRQMSNKSFEIIRSQPPSISYNDDSISVPDQSSNNREELHQQRIKNAEQRVMILKLQRSLELSKKEKDDMQAEKQRIEELRAKDVQLFITQDAQISQMQSLITDLYQQQYGTTFPPQPTQ